ncbi:MAG: CoA-binding protein [bacterium]
MNHGIEHLFNARSVAVVGASANPGKRGRIILKNLIEGGFTGGIYPVNPGAEEILGKKSYPSLGAIPEPVDLIVVCIPAAGVPALIREAGRHEVKGAVVISGGFREVGNLQLEGELYRAGQESGVRIVGPNCQGINYTPNHLCASWPLIRTQGSMAIISQSGTIGAALAEWAEEDGIGFSAFISLGNRLDVNESELVEFFSSDPATRSIALYLEGVKDGRAFMAQLKQATAVKPVVVLKAGRTIRGREAAQSHTKSVAGDDAIFDAACKQSGARKAESITELYDAAKAGGMLPALDPSLLIITSSGGSGILATDAAESNGMQVPVLEPEIKAALAEALPSQCILGNPLDLTGDTDAERYAVAARIAAQWKVAANLLLIFGDPIPGAGEMVDRLRREIPQQIIVSYLGGGEEGKIESRKLLDLGVATFPTPERAVKAICTLRRERKDYSEKEFIISKTMPKEDLL